MIQRLPVFTATRGNIAPLLNQIHHCDALDLLRRLPDASVDLIATDPPYHAIVSSEWDNQWDNAQQFLEWVSVLVQEFKRVLKSNGSLYIFASHKLHAPVEWVVSKHFHVLNNIVWYKSQSTTRQTDRTAMRSFIPTTEHVIFAEQKDGDSVADDLAGYTQADRNLKVRIFGQYLQSEFDKADIDRKEVASLFPSVTGNLTGCVRNWKLGYNIPTKEQYETMRKYFYQKTGRLYLTHDYDELRRQYDELRRQYDELRRPFNLDIAGDNECNVWLFSPPSKREHPTQKPVEIMEHIIKVSSRFGAIVLDPFMGSGTTAQAALKLGRQYIGCDITPEYVALARKRLADTDPFQATVYEDGTKQLSLFETGA